MLKMYAVFLQFQRHQYIHFSRQEQWLQKIDNSALNSIVRYMPEGNICQKPFSDITYHSKSFGFLKLKDYHSVCHLVLRDVPHLPPEPCDNR